MNGVIIQARTGSTRLPGKIFMDLNGKYSIQRILDGCCKTVYPNKIILAMPVEDGNVIKERIEKGELDKHIDDRFDLFIHNGDSSDLVDRFYLASRRFGLDTIIRITADCPMIEGFYLGIDEMVAKYMKEGQEGFMGNNLIVAQNPYPCGIDVEIFNYEMICWAKKHAKSNYDLEHCVPIFYSDMSPFKTMAFNNNRPNTMVSKRISDFSLDTVSDYKLLSRLTECYDKLKDLNKAIESVFVGDFDKTNMSKNFRN